MLGTASAALGGCGEQGRCQGCWHTHTLIMAAPCYWLLDSPCYCQGCWHTPCYCLLDSPCYWLLAHPLSLSGLLSHTHPVNGCPLLLAVGLPLSLAVGLPLSLSGLLAHPLLLSGLSARSLFVATLCSWVFGTPLVTVRAVGTPPITVRPPVNARAVGLPLILLGLLAHPLLLA